MSKEIAEIKYYISDTSFDDFLTEDDIPEDDTIVENTFEQALHLRIVECLMEMKQFIKNGHYELLENFSYSELYDFLTE